MLWWCLQQLEGCLIDDAVVMLGVSCLWKEREGPYLMSLPRDVSGAKLSSNFEVRQTR